MALNSNALVTLAKANSFLGTSGVDTEIERLINVASQTIAKYCKRVLVNTDHTEYHDGRRTHVLQVREWPINGGPGGAGKPDVFVDANSEFAADTELDADEIYVHEKGTLIYLRQGTFQKGTRNIKVVYQAGLGVGGDSASMPADLENACLDFVSWKYRQNADRRLGIEQKSKLGETVTYELGIPKFIRDQIEPYVRQEFPVSNQLVRNY